MYQLASRRIAFNRTFASLTAVAVVAALAAPVFMLLSIVTQGSHALYAHQLRLAVPSVIGADPYETLQQSLQTILPLSENAALAQAVMPLLSESAENTLAAQLKDTPHAATVSVPLSAAADAVLKHQLLAWPTQPYDGKFTWRALPNGDLAFTGNVLKAIVLLPAEQGSVLLYGAHGIGKIQQWQGDTLLVTPIVPFNGNSTATLTSITINSAEATRVLPDASLAVLHVLQRGGGVVSQFNSQFFTGTDSRLPEMAGIYGSLRGSLLTLLLCSIFCVPVGIAAAVWLEEAKIGSRRARQLAAVAELNIANAASVPSVIYGLLGAAVFLQTLGMARSSPLVGSLVLSLIMLPIVITATREALRNVSPTLRQSALALGATPLQALLQHVLPQAKFGIITGVLLGLARVAGESAPLLLIGMAAFVPGVPHGINDAAAALPTQIYLWADSPDSGFVEKTAAAATVLIAVLLVLQLPLLWLRREK